LGFDRLDGLPSPEAVLQRVHPDDRERFNDVTTRGAREKADYKVEFRIIFPGGTIKYIELAGHPKYSADGEFLEVVGTIIDVTERKRAQDEHERLGQLETDLAHMNRLGMMGELSASLAHEIKQPIAAARNNARAAMNFLDMQPPDLDEVREALDCVVGDVDRAGNIIDGVRDQIKKAPSRVERFDLNEAIKKVIVLARGAITKNAVSDQIGTMEDALFVAGDRVQLQQVLLNLILNAVEAMGSVQEGPRVLSIGAANGKWRPRGSRRLRTGYCCEAYRARFRRLLHHEVRWTRNGIVDLPVYHRCAWRSAVGRGERAARRRVSVLAARCGSWLVNPLRVLRKDKRS
jgi:signal transduction histidine kinase